MGMVQSRGGARFALKAFQSLAVLGKMFRQELQGDEPAELHVLGLVDHTHATATQLLEDAMMRKGSAYHCFETGNWKFETRNSKSETRTNPN
jgi:hypothetical protein